MKIGQKSVTSILTIIKVVVLSILFCLKVMVLGKSRSTFRISITKLTFLPAKIKVTVASVLISIKSYGSFLNWIFRCLMRMSLIRASLLFVIGVFNCRFWILQIRKILKFEVLRKKSHRGRNLNLIGHFSDFISSLISAVF